VTVIDTSAILAILLQEQEAQAFATFLEAQETIILSAATLTEAGIAVLRRGGPPLFRDLERLLDEISGQVVELTAARSRAAIDAYVRYGFGIGRPPCLNFGDCFSYAVAREMGLPLLYKGEDFAKTDILSAL
jgi:ribonuclease VapC